MNLELDNKLMDKYPEIFAQRGEGPDKTMLCWGICCEDGWYDLLDMLCTDIYAFAEEHDTRIPQVAQIKQKFGGLRFYVDMGEDNIYNLISRAENESYYICEMCGTRKNIGQTRDWIRTVCGDCAKKNRWFTWMSYKDLEELERKAEADVVNDDTKS